MEKEYILHKWLNDSATSEELENLKTSPEYNAYMKIAKISSKFEAPDSESELNFKAISLKIKNGKVRRLRPVSFFLKIAAVLALVFSTYLYIEFKNSSIETHIAEKRTLFLPDDSEVTLNSNSVIEYSKNKWNNQRELKLKGEAYFKVKKGSTFKVKTPIGDVSVLGTQFNVFARANSFYIDCYEGLVSVTFSDTLVKLPAGSLLRIENGKIVTHENSLNTSPSWTTNESSFNNVPLINVIEELEGQYPIKLTAKISEGDRRFTGSFTHDDLNLALKSICDPLRLTFTIEEESVSIYAKEN